MKRKVFYSFHYDNEVFRVQQIRNMGILEGNAPTSPNAWEELKQKGDSAVEKWIDDNLKGTSCLIVLIGEKTAMSKWVNYEIRRAWEMGKGVLGIYVHNMKDPKTGLAKKGMNPFEQITFKKNGRSLSSVVTCYDPSPNDAYKSIAYNIENWIEKAITSR